MHDIAKAELNRIEVKASFILLMRQTKTECNIFFYQYYSISH